MKGKVTCPRCSFVFIVEGEAGKDKNVKCPKCGHEFIVKIGKAKNKDVRWIEYGGARKAILPIPEDLSNHPLVAGVLLATASICGIVTACIHYMYPNSKVVIPYDVLFGNELYTSLLILIFSVLSIAGAYSSIKKKSVPVALLGCIFGILSFGFLVIGPVLSIISLILLIISKDDFDKSLHGKEF